jgi:hypothetical protein
MARPRTYNHSRFDGGMAHNKRDTSDLTKLGLISHLDIYRDHSEMHVMPGFVSDNGFDGSATGLKTYKIQNFTQAFGILYGLGTKSDGTGSKVLQRTITDSEWKVPTTVAFQAEGSHNLASKPFFIYDDIVGDFYYPVIVGTAQRMARLGFSSNAFAGGYEDWQAWLGSVTSGYLYSVKSFNGKFYTTKGGFQGISEIGSTGVTVNAKTTALFPRTLAVGDYTMGIFGVQSNPRESRCLIWDSASLLADQNVRMGAEQVEASGFPNNIYAAVSVAAPQALETNGKSFMSVRVLEGESARVLYRIDAPTATNQATHDMNDYYYNSMLWYGRVPTNAAGTTFTEGVWALGSGGIGGQFGVSLLLDTTNLGLVERASVFGFGMYFAHDGDGSVSRLDNFETGTYNVPATIETLIYGADSPYQKELKGVSIVTEDLPSGGSVVCSYRTDEDSAWTTMGTSDTAGKQRHSFTKANGTPIGKFQEIQFKFVITGKTSVKNIRVDIIETSDLPY